MAQATSYSQKTPVVASDEVILIDNAASGAIKRARVDDIAFRATKGVAVPRSTEAAAAFAIAANATGSNFTLASGATAQPFGATAWVGLILVFNESSGVSGLFYSDFFATRELFDFDNLFSAASGTASMTNIYKTNSGQPVVIQNNTASSRTYSVIGIRLY